jgi:hypothetical protein
VNGDHWSYIVVVSLLFLQAAVTNKLHPCPNCSEMVRAKKMKQHEDQECPHRLVFCPNKDCRRIIQAHNLEHHLRFTCESNSIRKRLVACSNQLCVNSDCFYILLFIPIRYWLVQRARERTNYPRPWGVTLCMPCGDGNNDEEGIDDDDDGEVVTFGTGAAGSSKRDDTEYDEDNAEDYDEGAEPRDETKAGGGDDEDDRDFDLDDI